MTFKVKGETELCGKKSGNGHNATLSLMGCRLCGLIRKAGILKWVQNVTTTD